MKKPALVFTKRADKEIERANAWWQKNRPSAPDAIYEELAAALELLTTAPEAGAVALDQELRGVRRLFLTRIDYHLYYRVEPERGRLTVLTFWHARRRPPKL